MKLFARYSRINLVATIIIFVIASVAFWLALRFVVISQVDQDLEIEEKEIQTFVGEHNRLPENISVNDQMISYRPARQAMDRQFKITAFRQKGETTKENFRQLLFSIQAQGQWYQVTVSKSLEETETLTSSVLYIALSTIILILFVTFIINRIVLKRLWKPFYLSLNTASSFKIDSNKKLVLPASGINEFELMNETIQKVANRAQLDYISLKTFSENASHEIQTPLAVIQTKLDLLLQDEQLTQRQSDYLLAAFRSVQKLSRLNQSLLLLAKIENKQFQEIQNIDVEKRLHEKIADFHELWIGNELNISVASEKASMTINAELLEILLNNLLSNATNHNYKGGKLDIRLKSHSLLIANTALNHAIDSKTIYQRFSNSSSVDGNGLGLAIIKQICDVSGFKIDYSYKDEMHCFTLNWA